MSEACAVPFSALQAPRHGFCPGLPGALSRPVVHEPIHAEAEEDRYARGFADGVAAARDQQATNEQAIARLIDAVRSLQPQASETVAALIAEATRQLVHEIAGNCPVAPDALLRRAERAALFLSEEDGATLLYVHPDDAALLPGEIAGLTVTPKDGLSRGDVVIPCLAGTIEDRIANRLAAVDAALGLDPAL